MKKEKRTYTCIYCFKEHSVELPTEEWKKYFLGKSVYEALKSASTVEKEQVASHLCPECQEKVFKI